MEIFQKDIFSSSLPMFLPVQQDKADLIRTTLRNNYDEGQFEIKEITQIDALEINSNNFKLDINGKKFLFKRARINSSAETLESQFVLSEHLRSLGCPFAPSIRNREGSYATQSYDRVWILTDFISGNYFSGNPQELNQVGEQVGRLFHCLTNLNKQNLPVNPSVDGVSRITESSNRLHACRNEWQAIFPQVDYDLLSQNLNLLQQATSKILSNLESIQSLSCLPCHIDLHPHNILIKDNQVSAFVDVESLQISRQLISLAFTIYKLVRQYAVFAELQEEHREEISHAALVFLNAVDKNLKLDNIMIENLEMCAVFEILRRILLITDLNIIHRNTSWNKVLTMHFAGLREVPIIFSKVGTVL